LLLEQRALTGDVLRDSRKLRMKIPLPPVTREVDGSPGVQYTEAVSQQPLLQQPTDVCLDQDDALRRETSEVLPQQRVISDKNSIFLLARSAV